MTNYQKGYRIERELKLLLEHADFYVTRSAGSHGAADLVAIDKINGNIKMIQIKNHKPTKQDRIKIRKLEQELMFPHISCELWYRMNGLWYIDGVEEHK